MTICIVGDPRDLTSVYLGWLARRRGLDVVELREDNLGSEWRFEFSDICPSEGSLHVDGADYPFAAIAGAYVRFNPHPSLPPTLALEPHEEAVLLMERRNGVQHFLNMAPFPVANRPGAGRSNSSKPYQMRLLARWGFAVPRWTATNDAAAVQAFVASCRTGAIYKSCSGLRSHVRRTDEELLRRLRDGTSPVIVQEYIPGRDVRVHVVQEQVFPTEVLATGVDYRFDDEGGQFRETAMPSSLAEQCCAFAGTEGLPVAGFDFRVTPDGDWYCLEMNPVPTFLPYEMATSQRIGDAILDIFSTHNCNGPVNQ